jgi:beta-lactamase class A
MLKSKNAIVTAVLLLLVGTIGFFLGKNISTTAEEINNKASQEKEDFNESRSRGTYKYINPLLECDNFNPSKMISLVQLESDLKNYINQSLTKGYSSHVSIYFRSLNNGPWIGIDENYNYSPASLLKVPIMIAVLKKAEYEPGLLKKKISYTELKDLEYTPNIKDNLIKIGNSYTVEELLISMIKYSDNEAKELLIDVVGDENVITSMNEIGINTNGVDLSKDFISVKGYSSFFRFLYNATYLNKEMSEKALEILSTTNFKTGLPAKLPKDIVVSHKFGERGYVDTNLKQLHDCGIIYIPGNPYLLCVMTKGDSFDELDDVIADVSEIVYKAVSENSIK